jgi:hypothetical protein
MFCPRCGQQQVSGDVRFCARCGLSLAAVPALLSEVSAVRPAEGPRQGGLLAGKRAGVRRGAKLMFFSAVLTPIFFVLGLAVDSPAPLLVPLAVFLAGLAFMLYHVLFGDEPLTAPGSERQRDLYEPRGGQALPPGGFVPAPGFAGRRANTADMAQPPSVTEQTTRLLDEE